MKTTKVLKNIIKEIDKADNSVILTNTKSDLEKYSGIAADTIELVYSCIEELYEIENSKDSSTIIDQLKYISKNIEVLICLRNERTFKNIDNVCVNILKHSNTRMAS